MYLHTDSLAHLAIHPKNIYFQRKTQLHIKLGDFGIGLHHEVRFKEKDSLARKYIAPEVLKKLDEGNVLEPSDPGATAADVYSLGIVFRDIKKHIGNLNVF